MRTTLALLTAMTLLAFGSNASADTTCVAFEPGKTLGPITIGMSRANLDKLNLPIKEGFTKGVLNVGPYTVWFDGKVTAASLGLAKTPCLKIKGKKVKTTDSKLETLAQHIGSCGPFQMNTGGNIIECSGALLGQHMGGLEVRILSTAKPPATKCDGYVAPGAPNSSASKLDIKPGKTYCVGTRLFTPKLIKTLKPSDITALDGVLRYNTCTTTVNIGATSVQCDYNGVKFTFAGPRAQLSTIEAVTLKN